MTGLHIAIIGGGLGGFTLAKELRERGHAGRITLIDPQGVPYDRPPLSKGYLLGERDAADIEFEPAAWYAERGIELLRAAATAIEPDSGLIVLDDGRRLQADRIVLATGGRARRLAIPGGDDERLLVLRERADAERLRRALGSPGTRLAIVGAGLIGAEAASAALELGAEVTLIDPVDPPLVPAVGAELARWLHELHARRGVRTLTGLPERIEWDADAVRIHLAGQPAVSADVVLAGVGIVPNTELAEAAGLAVDGGVLVDARQRSSHERVWAIGDLARHRDDDGTLHRRSEHWDHAIQSGTRAAAALLDQPAPAGQTAWFWSDRHGVHVEGAGSLVGDGELVHRRSPEGAPVASFLIGPDGLLRGAAAIDGGLTVRAARRIIDRRIAVDPRQLADPDVELRRLAR